MNKFIPRKVLPKLEKYIKNKQITTVTGMRRVGKTTLLKYLYKNISSKNKVFFDLEDILIRKIFSQSNYKNIVSSLQQEGIDFGQKSYIFIDEIQLVKNIPSVIKYLYDKYNIKFVISGSSSYYLKNLFTESLAGRKIIVELFPLTFEEFLVFKGVEKKSFHTFDKKISNNDEINIEKFNNLYREYMIFGGFPEVVLTRNKEIKKEILKDILNSYFQIDVASLTDFKEVSKIRDTLTLLTQRVGQKINVTKIANALGIKRDKIYEYLEFLQSTYVIRLISQKSSIDNQASANSKLYFTDTGLAQLLGDISEGSQFENSVFMNLVYDYDLTYYQTKSGGEIDFVLDSKIGLEVKQSPSKQDMANLKKRAQSAKIREYYLVGMKSTPVDKVIMAWDL